MTPQDYDALVETRARRLLLDCTEDHVKAYCTLMHMADEHTHPHTNVRQCAIALAANRVRPEDITSGMQEF